MNCKTPKSNTRKANDQPMIAPTSTQNLPIQDAAGLNINKIMDI